MKSCVTIALVPTLQTGPWVYWHDLADSLHRAAALGFDAVELFTASADALDPAAVGRACRASGLRVGAVGTGAGNVLHGLTLTDPSPAVRRAAVAFIREMIAFGARLEAPAIIGSIQGSAAGHVTRPQALDWLAAVRLPATDGDPSAARQALHAHPLHRALLQVNGLCPAP